MLSNLWMSNGRLYQFIAKGLFSINSSEYEIWWGCHPDLILLCAPSMGDDWWVKVPYGGWSHQPLAKGKGVTVKWGLEEARGKPAI